MDRLESQWLFKVKLIEITQEVTGSGKKTEVACEAYIVSDYDISHLARVCHGISK